jgi:hypothetical protein
MRILTRWSFPKKKLFVVVLIPAVIGAFIGSLLIDQQVGRSIPSSYPDNSNRVYHPRGFSIIKPADWRYFNSLDTIVISPSSFRNSDFINVKILQDAPNFVANFTFNGAPAFKSEIYSESEKTGNYRWSIIFKTNNEYFQITYVRSSNVTVKSLPYEIYRYLCTFKF